MTRALLLLAATSTTWVGTGSRALAQPPAEPIRCDEGGTTQHDMNLCATRAARDARRRLDSLLTELERRLSPPQWAELREVQATWEHFVEKDCRWERGMFEGGSVAPMVNAYCIQSRLIERIERLKPFRCEGAGMTGPCD